MLLKTNCRSPTEEELISFSKQWNPIFGQVSSLSFSKESLVVPSIVRCSKLLKYTEIMKRKVHLVTLIFPGTLRKIDFPGAPEKGSFEVHALVKGYRGGQKHDKSG